MNTIKTTALVILNKNDGESLDRVLNEIQISDFDSVIGIDGNSTDISCQVFEKHNIKYLQNIPGGRGGGIKFAINNVKEERVIFLSSDGEENPSDIASIRRELDLGADLVIASRMAENNSGFKSDYNMLYIHRKIFLMFITTMINILFHGHVKDCWNGYRGMSVAKARSLNFDAKDFLLEAQITIRFLKAKYVVKEVPTVERARYFGKSQNPAISSGWGHIVLLFKEFLKAN